MRVLRNLVKLVLRQPAFAPIWAWLLARRLRPLQVTGSPGALRVLVFNYHRWGADLDALRRRDGVDFIAFDLALPDVINSLFKTTGPENLGPWGKIHYYKETDAQELRRRDTQRRFIARVLRSLKRQADIHVAITPAIHYAREFEWVAACELARLPMIAVHKEFTIIDDRHMQGRVDRWNMRQFKFQGAHICVVNDFAKRLFASTGIAPAERISVTGMLRLDEILRPTSPYRQPARREQPLVTLFSFPHLIGDFDDDIGETRNMYFSLTGDTGYVSLFRETHVAFAKLALARPDVDFAIKAKLVTDGWRDEIDQVLRPALGKSIADIPNLHWVRTPALQLIRDSAAVIAFNSSVVLESRALGRPTILPLFAEAVSPYDRETYFLPFRDMFAVANSADALMSLVEHCLAGETIMPENRQRLTEMIEYYGGASDAKNAERVVEVLRHYAAAYGQEPNAIAQQSTAAVAAGR